MNWTGRRYVVPRDRWLEVKLRPDLAKRGVYILHGYEFDELGVARNALSVTSARPTTFVIVSMTTM